jgi:hypothetical protein
MPFGKYKGVEVEDIPRSYLVWIEANVPLRGNLAEEVYNVLRGLPSPNPDVAELLGKSIDEQLAELQKETR